MASCQEGRLEVADLHSQSTNRCPWCLIAADRTKVTVSVTVTVTVTVTVAVRERERELVTITGAVTDLDAVKDSVQFLIE